MWRHKFEFCMQKPPKSNQTRKRRAGWRDFETIWRVNNEKKTQRHAVAVGPQSVDERVGKKKKTQSHISKHARLI